jgi:uncharacterized protein
MNIRQFYMGKAIGFIVLMAIVGIVAFAYSLSQKFKDEATTQKEAHIIPSSTPNLLSLLLLANQEFDGRDLKLGDVQVNNNFYTKYFASYKSGDLTISGVMYIPKGTGPFPVLILNHGYIDPKIYTNGRGLRREQDYFARNGFIVFHPDYRGHAQSDSDPNIEKNIRLGYVEDVINAVQAIKSSNIPQADKNNIGMLGHSMGGGITQQILVVKPDLVKAAVLYAPVSSDVSDSYYRYYREREEDEDVKIKLEDLYGDPQQNPEFWRGISPRTYFEKVQVPIMIFHGTADKDVPLDWSHESVKILKDLSKDITLVEYPGEGHEFGLAHDNFMKQATIFFNKYLRP